MVCSEQKRPSEGFEKQNEPRTWHCRHFIQGIEEAWKQEGKMKMKMNVEVTMKDAGANE